MTALLFSTAVTLIVLAAYSVQQLFDTWTDEAEFAIQRSRFIQTLGEQDDA